MNYKRGKPLARILYKGLSKVLKYDDGSPDIDVEDPEHINRFGHKKPMLSVAEKLMSLPMKELKVALDSNDLLKKQFKEDMTNGEVPPNFLPKSSDPDKDGWIQKVDIPGSRFILTFDPKDFREIVYIYGASGSGKSVICRSYIDEYKREFPLNKIYLFSLKEGDVTLEDKDIIRIPNRLDVLINIDIETLRDSLVIFDDVETHGNDLTHEQKEVVRIQDSIAQLGRDRRIFCIVSTHLACRGNKSKVILNECHKIISFSGRVPVRAFKYLMEEYGGVEPKEVTKMWKLKSRWVCINKENPRCVISEEGCYTLS
jgi:Cdc6-like AAA superfamily ATPase